MYFAYSIADRYTTSFENLAVAHAAERGLGEDRVLVDAREGRERVDEADIRAFRRFDRADAAVIRRVHIAHLEAGTLTG